MKRNKRRDITKVGEFEKQFDWHLTLCCDVLPNVGTVSGTAFCNPSQLTRARMLHVSKHLHVLTVKICNNKDPILRSSGNFPKNSGRLKKLGDWVNFIVFCLLASQEFYLWFTFIFHLIRLSSEEKVKGREIVVWTGWSYGPPQPNYVRSWDAVEFERRCLRITWIICPENKKLFPTELVARFVLNFCK